MFTYISIEMKNLKEKLDMKTADVIAVKKEKGGSNPIFREIENERRHTNFIRVIPASIALLVVEFCGMLWAVWSHIKFDYGRGFLISSIVFLLVSVAFICLVENGLKRPFLSEKTKKFTYSLYWILFTLEAMSFSVMEFLDRGEYNNYITYIIVFTLLPILEPVSKTLLYVFAMGVEVYTMLFVNELLKPVDVGNMIICVAITMLGIIFSFARFYFYTSDALVKKRYQYSANGDPLTGFMNRRGFETSVPSLRDFCENNEYNFCVIIFDIDDFKGFNDTYGHLKGDVCIQAVSDCIRQGFSRPTDLCVRYGGEEFVVVTAQHEIDRLIDHLVQTANKINQIKIDGVDRNVSVSVGVSACQGAGDNPLNHYIELADKQLYLAKTNGKNCVYYEGDGKRYEE